jgi:hypothetical protein
MVLRGNGYISICDRDAEIIHYDNTSRKELWKAQEEAAKMWQDSNYLFHTLIPNDNVLRSYKRKNYTFSIITLVNNKEQYNNFLNDLKNQKYSNNFEVIALPNFNNEYKGCSEALNIGKDLAEGEYVIYCHQDLRVPENWLSKISEHINNTSNFGFLGMAGVKYKVSNENDGAVYLTNEKQLDFYRRTIGNKFEIQCLDELCIIGKRSDIFRFDESNFDHYHWYGADICLQALSSGRKNYAIDADCTHLSDGVSNISKNSHKDKYLDGASKLFKKWKEKIGNFRTTTASFEKDSGKIIFLMYNHLSEDIKKTFPNEIKIS